mgnify:CR=1 FL=1
MKAGIEMHMTEHLDTLLAGLSAQAEDSSAPFATTRYTENGQELAIGDGLWGTCDATGPYRHDFTDPETGAALCFTTVTEGGKRGILALRSEPGEIETIVVRPGLMGSVSAYADGADRLDAAGGADPAWFAPIPEAERVSREELVRIADAYFSAIERNDGQGFYPFAEDCVRYEHGYRTSGEPDARDAGLARDPDTPYIPDFKALGVKEQFETGFFRFVTRIRDRRFVVVDPALGLVAALAFFDHDGTLREYELADGTPATAGLTQPFSWQIAEAFRIENGLITQIEAVLNPCPYGMKPNW